MVGVDDDAFAVFALPGFDGFNRREPLFLKILNHTLGRLKVGVHPVERISALPAACRTTHDKRQKRENQLFWDRYFIHNYI